MKHIQAFLDGNVLPSNLEDLKSEIRDIVAKAQNGVPQMKGVVAKKVMKFVRTVSKKLKQANLKKFYVTGTGLWVDDGDFQEFLKDAISDSANAPGGTYDYHWYTNTENTHDDVIYPAIGEEIHDLATKGGRLEACKHLNYLRTEIENQPKGKKGNLLSDGSANFIGRFKLKSGRLVSVHAGWGAEDGQWGCFGWSPRVWGAGGLFLSRKKLA